MTDDLLITECPAAFAEFARKHNGIVYLLQAMSGAGGISVAVADANIIISGGGSAEGSAFNAVGADGKLGAVVRHSTYVTPVTYPTAIKVIDTSVSVTASVLMDSGGLTVTNAAGHTLSIPFAGITYNIGIREVAVCDGVNTRAMLILGSAAY